MWLRRISRLRNDTLLPYKTPVKRHASQSSATTKPSSRIDKFISRSPRFLQGHLQSLRGAPVSHVTAFLILHELTAVIPLFGLAGAFHYYNWLPAYFSEGAWVVAGVEKFGRYARRKGWISEIEEAQAENEVKSGNAKEAEEGSGSNGGSGKWFDRGEGGVRWVVEFATAYAVVKALLVPRLFLSAWAAPRFARWTVIPILNVFRGRGNLAAQKMSR